MPASQGDISVTFLSVATLLFQDGRSAILTDGFFSSPSLLSVGLRKIALGASKRRWTHSRPANRV